MVSSNDDIYNVIEDFDIELPTKEQSQPRKKLLISKFQIQYLSNVSSKTQVLLSKENVAVVVAEAVFTNGPFFIFGCSHCEDLNVLFSLKFATEAAGFEHEAKNIDECIHIWQACSELLVHWGYYEETITSDQLQDILKEKLFGNEDDQIFSNNSDTVRVSVERSCKIQVFMLSQRSQRWKCLKCMNSKIVKCIHIRQVVDFKKNSLKCHERPSIDTKYLMVARSIFTCKYLKPQHNFF